MSNKIKITDNIRKKINKLEKDIISGNVSLLDYELVPIFEEIKKTLDIQTLESHSKNYGQAFSLLDKKFDELKRLLNSLDSEEKFTQFLKTDPSKFEIYELFRNCWVNPFIIEANSLQFLNKSMEQLCNTERKHYTIEHLEKENVSQEFFLEVPQQQFTEKMMEYFESIAAKLPCKFEDIFDEEQTQVEIYEHFVYILHLIQTGKLKYQKETQSLYI